jgi:hypothetical protein
MRVLKLVILSLGFIALLKDFDELVAGSSELIKIFKV